MNVENSKNVVLNILSLEDSVQDFEIIRDNLIDAGYDLNMSRVEKESEFESSLRKNKYDVILADFNLPGFDAFGALHLCSRICPDVPFICVSGAIGEETAIELLKQGAVDYVMKNKLKRLPFVVERALDEAKEKEARKQAEKTLKESEMSLEAAQEIAKMGNWEFDLFNKKLKWSKNFYRIFGYEPFEIVPTYALFIRQVHPDDLFLIEEAYSFINKTRKPVTLDIRYIMPDGSLKWMLSKLVPVFIENVLVMLKGICVDITERKQTEEALKKKTEELEYLNSHFVGRELKMVDLKTEINELLIKSGGKEKYVIHLETD